VIDSKTTANAQDVLRHVKRVIDFVSTKKRTEASTCVEGQRCLLYLDEQGRLFNLTLSGHSIAPANTWMEYLDTFSNLEAIIALTILCRSIPCMTSGTSEILDILLFCQQAQSHVESSYIFNVSLPIHR
jgi:hypothetical protein